ncbi:hypothetical protein C7B65_04340 [Phormidesmis priestleyi ULC007]|uniref:Uncharacterized protein n=1 Tax=Phormidesmis priestleyi ULC007 TaxID=1920490 RepID=A0A2T1DL20_9CYAN|nr:hypothetical protein [Phormidesmis priestleyi]PSB21173.1 hypothetical protein C7B65_04340 [Phormidesmis priestleyi ULC007]PZO51302.1 MAG: hypothetical protein DCF14_09370 [Phormidesmis priestleyi]
MDSFIFILKVLLLSIALSLLIKYAAPLVTIAPTTPIVLSAILLPSLTILLIFISRVALQKTSNDV